MNKIQGEKNFFDKIMATTLFEIFAVLYLAHKLLPIFGYYMPGIVYLGVFAATFAFGICISTNEDKINFSLSMLPVFLISVLTCIRYALMGNAGGIPIYLYGELQIYLYGIIAVWYIVKNRPNRAKFIFNLVLLGYAITGVTTYIGCIKYPQAARTMATLSNTDAIYQLYTKSNIGGFSFIYELVLILPLIIYMTKTKKINRIIGFLLTALIGMVVIKSEYATALILYTLSLILFIIPKLTGKKVIVFLFTALILVLIFKPFIASAFESLSNTIESETVAERFKYIADLLSGKSTVDAENNRIELYMKGLETFFENILLGTWDKSTTSGHSLIIDTLAMYGIIGVLFLITSYWVMYKIFIGKYKNRTYYSYILYIYLLGLFMAVINPKMNLFVFIFIVPMFAFVMDNERTKENKSEDFMGM